MMSRILAIVFVALVAIWPADSVAQQLVGRWSGWTDWPGTDFDADAAWWEFRPDGTFVDDYGATGTWSRSGNAVTFRYDDPPNTIWTGYISGRRMTGTMNNQHGSGTFALAAGYSAEAAGPRPAPAARTATQLDIEVCNRSGYNVLVAVLYRQNQQWRSEGWFRLANGRCGTIATSDNLTTYVYAEDAEGSGRFWGRGDLQHCVTRPGPYEEFINRTGVVCRDDQDLVEFTQLDAESFGSITWNLDP